MSTSRFRLSFFQILAAIALIPLGFAVISWVAAQSPAQNQRIPAEWPAGVPNHGEFYRWPLGTVHDSPVLFCVCVILLIACLLFLIISSSRSKRVSSA
jgi:hypothetical protein